LKYSSPSAFRESIEARIRNAPPEHQARLRKAIVFDRLVSRLISNNPPTWIVKGGFALDLRFGLNARSTKDLDLLSILSASETVEALLSIDQSPSDDHFEFNARVKSRVIGDQPSNTASFHVNALLDGRRFESINVDVEIAEARYFEPDLVSFVRFLDFAEVNPSAVPLIPLEQHLAEKLHAYARVFPASRENTRVKDLVDIVLISRLGNVRATALRDSIDSTFESRSNDSPPKHLPPPPKVWLSSYGTLATEIGIDPKLDSGYAAAKRFLDPILARDLEQAEWDSTSETWRKVQSDQSEPTG
jgi:hypothetical protein